MELKQINLKLKRVGPIRHTSLSPKLLKHIEGVHCLIGEYLVVNLEQFEIGFMRAENPELEVAFWCSVAAMWNDYHDEYLGHRLLPDDQERKIVAALIAILMGEQDVTHLPVSLEVGIRLLGCYQTLAKSVTVQQEPLQHDHTNASQPNPIAHTLRQSGPIRHESLSPELLARIGAVYRLIGKYLDVNLEQFEIGFMRKEMPKLEVAMWCSVAAAWADFHRKYIGRIQLPVREEKDLIAALFAIVSGETNLKKLPVPVEVGSRLLACYEGLLDS